MATGDRTRLLNRRAAATTQVGVRGVPWALLVLLLGTLLALVGAYALRPASAIAVGTRYDALFLGDGGLHDREFRAAAPMAAFVWPVGDDTLVIDAGLSPSFEMATLTLDDFTPSAQFKRRLVSLFVNGDEVANFADTGGGREFRTLLPPGAASRTLTMRAIPIPDKTTKIPPLQVTKVVLSAARTYRWTTDKSTVMLPALGRGDWRVTLRAIVAHPDQQPVGAKLFANGRLIADLPDYAGARNISALIPAAVVGDGDLTLTVEATPFRDPRPLGILIERISFAPIGGVSPATALPPISLLVPGLVIVAAVYGSLRRAGARPWAATVAGLALALVGAWALVAFRYPVAFYMRPLAVLMLFSFAVALFVDWFSAWLFAKLDIPLAPWLRHALLLVFLIGFWLKAGGLIFPYMRAIDIQEHMAWVRRMLADHSLIGQLYGVHSPLNEDTMPVAEWGANRPVIPYSPFFHFFALAFAVLPWKLETTANVFSALLDNSRVFVIALLTLKAGLSNRATLLAALLYAITPVTFLLHAWGNVPTTFGLWWALVATAIIITCWERLDRPWPFALLTLATLAGLLFYTVTAAFHMLFVILFAIIVLLLRKTIDARPLRPMLLATGLAFALSLLAYYGQYIPPVLTKTLPYIAAVFTQGSQTVGVARPPLSAYLLDFLPHLGYWLWPGRYLYYGLALPLLALIPGFVMLWKRQPLWTALAAWFSVATLFMIVGYRISMVDKQLFYIVPALCICAAPVADWLWQKGLWGRALVIAVYAGTFGSALALWVLRIQRSPFG